MSKTATITQIKIAEQKQFSATTREMLGLTVTAYYMVEYETGIKLLYSALGYMKDKERMERLIHNLTTRQHLGFWNWWINYRQNQERIYMRETLTSRFRNFERHDPKEAQRLLLEHWKLMHDDIAVGEISIICCTNFIKNKLYYI